MILYTTATSERASKGQGGNEYIDIQLTVQNGSKLDYSVGMLSLQYKDDVKDHGADENEWMLLFKKHEDDDWDVIAQGHVRPPESKTIKGKRQKGD